jgi:hypothetical protein
MISPFGYVDIGPEAYRKSEEDRGDSDELHDVSGLRI